jgi:hypothetical protein
MHTLAVLRFCREVLSERQRQDQWQGWLWGIRRKVIDYWISRIENETEGSAATPELNAEEQEAIRCSHPLLMSRPTTSGPPIEIDRSWQADLRDRVHRYLAAVKSHR